MRRGDFSNFRNAHGQMIPIYDPLTTDAAGNRTAFPGNIIPHQSHQPVPAQAFANALPLPTLHPEYDDGTLNLPAQTIIESTARQFSLKLDHHFSENISLNGVFLNQSTFEPDINYFPDAPYAADAFHLQRDVNVFVLNNTYILSPTTVATFRVGMNTFSDDNAMPYPIRHARRARHQRDFAELAPGPEVPGPDAQWRLPQHREHRPERHAITTRGVSMVR